MEVKYFIIINGQQKGPVTKDNLSQLGCTTESMIWSEGFPDWKKAGTVDELKTLFLISTPPPFNQHNVNPQQQTRVLTKEINSSVVTEESFFEKNKLYLIISFGILIILSLIVFNTKSDSKTGVNEKTVTDKESIDYDNSESPTTIPINNNQYSPVEKEQKQAPTKRLLTEEDIRQELFSKEASSPTNYLVADGSYRVNLAANTIITGTITNNASIAGFKNIKLSAKFYSKTDLLLGKESFIIMEFVDAQSSINFTYKISGWWSDVDHWSLDVVSSEAY